ncbi:DUF1992 domain-containing protein [Knoellia aerolata]|uniref:DnaJ homologue subfamily C member 28 conserved domain-containing protein n=1 Tax=Knoellia aerolata DSM 18566 TaxID=1385519 RepID=A0A0A0JWS3_9MICO|nr:DUF1992 domain-containing protein [Knoellia aerolata]KGN41154.1 hypothetical protein N801_09285 [Knoellia aerolata DSM 18566]
MSFQESWVEKQIREAQERGDFDNLPGAGRPLQGLDDPDPDWWVKRMMAREGLDLADAMPPVLMLRREFAGFPESLVELRTEEGVREVLCDYNLRVVDDRRRPVLGKQSPVWAPTVDVEDMLRRWRELRAERLAAQAPEPGPEPEPGPPASPPRRRRWWQIWRP